MTSTVPGLTIPEIAEKYGRPARTIEWWRLRYDWPGPTGTRRGTGRPLEYDPGEVDAAVRAILGILPGGEDGDPDELLNAEQAAAEAGLAYGTVRARISRGRWPKPEPDEGSGVKLWRRQAIRDFRASMRPDRRRRGVG